MVKESRTLRISIEPSTLLLIAGVAVLLLGLFRIYDIILVVLTAVVIATFVQTLARPFQKIRIPRIVSIILVYILATIVFGGLLYALVPIFLGELVLLSGFLPEDTFLIHVLQMFGDFINAREALALTGASAGNLFIETIRETLPSIGTGLLSSSAQAFGGILNVTLIFVVSFYLAVDDTGLERFLRSVTPVRHEEYILSLWDRAYKKIIAWFRGQLVLALILSILIYVGLVLMGVEYALILSVVAGVFGLVPFGIFLAMVPAVLAGFSTGGVSLALLVFVYFILLNQIQDYVFGPWVLRQATGVPALVILLALVVGVKLAGFLGFFLGLPLAILLVEIINDREEIHRKALERTKRISAKKSAQ